MHLERVRVWACAIKRDIGALWLAARDPRLPWFAKAVAAMVAAYALSPIDLIPDFIPILGYVDDLLILPLGIMVAVRLIPAAVLAELREQALERPGPSKLGLAFIIATWLAAAGLAAWLLYPS
ncbi:YkvA family protein [Sphingomonas sp.]|jgi:uncharacterized membrane protein YkvA (DUF1232 family)|uniref:YkvA family protein n=1 Tax=Sphingomonas sp. TaxID=28214 RepID=UPI002DF433F6|nr:DUF1232 domain-containing protein [Sphingomonas sp.]